MVMDSLYFNDYSEFVDHIGMRYACDELDYEDDVVTIIAKYDAACAVIRELIYTGEFDLGEITLSSEYDKEYIISIMDSEIWCEPMYRDYGYITDASTVAYILGDCSSKVISHCETSEMFEVNIIWDDEDEQICDKICCHDCIGRCCEGDTCKSKANDVSNSSLSTQSTYTINGESVSKEEFKEACDKLTKELYDKISHSRNIKTIFNY